MELATFFTGNWHDCIALCPVPCQRGRQWRHGKSPHGGPSHPAGDGTWPPGVNVTTTPTTHGLNAEDLQISGDLTHSCLFFLPTN
jgi:hypothetical protein